MTSDRATTDPGAAAYDGFLLDLDGTLYRGSEVIDGAPGTVETLRGRGRPVRFVTNNAARTTHDVVEQLREAGFPAREDEVHSSSHAAAAVLAEHLAAGSPVLVLGTEALAGRVRDVGLCPVRQRSGDVAAVVQGHNPDTGWYELSEACVAIRAGAWWVACNTDTTLPSERGELPGNGAMVAALRVATGEEPVVAGKPQAPLLTLAAAATGCANPLVVGDRLETDIAGAHAAGFDSLLVLSGVSTPLGVLRAPTEQRPRYIGSDVTCLADSLTQLEVGSCTGTGSDWLVSSDGTVLMVSQLDSQVGSRADTAALALLRKLAPVAWSTGVLPTRAADAAARAALTELGLPA